MSDPGTSDDSCEDEETFQMTGGSDEGEGGSEDNTQDELTDLPGESPHTAVSQVTIIAAAPAGTHSDSSVGSEDYVVYGTTPPRSSRYIHTLNVIGFDYLHLA